jgi:cyclophilin family peptidyl-prolyl cis-trans isomerase
MDTQKIVILVMVPVAIIALIVLAKGPMNKKTNDTANLSLNSNQEPETLETTNMPDLTTTQSVKEPQEEKETAQKSYTAILKTDKGDITIKLNDQETPKTVENFVTLSKKNFYNGTIFHRVVKGFMIQGGDPNGNGTGGPGYKFDDEPFTGEYTRGTVAMANSGPNTNGSQFFIMHQDYNLPKDYVIFGKVTSGLEVVDEIANLEVEPNAGGEMSKPVSPATVNSVEIIEE